MNASDLLHSLSADGFSLHIVDGGRLSVTPAARLTDQLRFLIRQHRDALVDLLSSRTPPPLTAIEQHAITEAVAERAAIMEFDGKLPRVIAESEASSRMRVYQALIAMPDGSAPRWLVYLAPGSTLAEAHQDLVSKFGAERVMKVLEHQADSEQREVA